MKTRRKVRGFMLVEVLVSILIFALGLLAIVSLQARTATTTGDIQFRAEAMHFANAYVGKMWAMIPAPPSGDPAGQDGLIDLFQNGAQRNIFQTLVSDPVLGLPNGNISNVTITRGTGAAGDIPVTSMRVSIQIDWTGADGEPHNYVHTSVIGRNP
jgi:Tfp pilus assembly protein PilV